MLLDILRTTVASPQGQGLMLDVAARGPAAAVQTAAAAAPTGLYNTNLDSNGGFVTETGQAAVLDVGLVTSAGSFTETGEPATFDVALVAASGSFTETGEAVTFDAALTAAVGPFTETGEAVTFDVALATASGSFVETGEPATFDVALAAGTGFFTLTLYPRPVPPQAPLIFSGTGTGPGWIPRTLAELIGADSRLTIADIRKLLQPAVLPTQLQIQQAPLPYIPLTVTPNLLTPPDDMEEEELLLHLV